MVKRGKMQDLAAYIRDLESKGYDIRAIKNALIKYGYPEAVVNQAIYNLNRTEINHTIHLSKTTLAAIIVIVLGLLGIALLMFNPFEQKKVPEKLLDVKINKISSSVMPDSELSASIQLTNMGAKNRYDLYLKYEIINEETQKRLTFSSETIAMETSKAQDIEIKIPNDAPEGRYIFQVTARHPSGTALSQTPFIITSNPSAIEETCFDGIKNQNEEEIDCGGKCEPCKKCPSNCEDNNPSTIDYCDSSIKECVHKVPSSCGDELCSGNENENTCPKDCEIPKPPSNNVWDELERIKKLAETNSANALQECSKIDSTFKDKCLQNVGEVSNKPEICDKISQETEESRLSRERCFSNVARALHKVQLCEYIQKDSRKDSCYVNFAIDGDYSVCEKISNPYLKKSCETLRQTSQ